IRCCRWSWGLLLVSSLLRGRSCGTGAQERGASTGHGEATRDAQDLSGHVGGRIAREEEHRPRQVVRLADAPERDGAGERLHQLLRVARALLVVCEERGVRG